MGHEGITVLQRYLIEIHQDTEIGHRKTSPVEEGLFIVEYKYPIQKAE